MRRSTLYRRVTLRARPGLIVNVRKNLFACLFTLYCIYMLSEYYPHPCCCYHPLYVHRVRLHRHHRGHPFSIRPPSPPSSPTVVYNASGFSPLTTSTWRTALHLCTLALSYIRLLFSSPYTSLHSYPGNYNVLQRSREPVSKHST